MTRTVDPLELRLTRFLEDRHIRFTRPDSDPSDVSTLDFHLPDLNVSIEVKAWSTERLHDQIVRSQQDGRVIVLIGAHAVEAFIALCGTGTP